MEIYCGNNQRASTYKQVLLMVSSASMLTSSMKRPRTMQPLSSGLPTLKWWISSSGFWGLQEKETGYCIFLPSEKCSHVFFCIRQSKLCKIPDSLLQWDALSAKYTPSSRQRTERGQIFCAKARFCWVSQWDLDPSCSFVSLDQRVQCPVADTFYQNGDFFLFYQFFPFLI